MNAGLYLVSFFTQREMVGRWIPSTCEDDYVWPPQSKFLTGGPVAYIASSDTYT